MNQMSIQWQTNKQHILKKCLSADLIWHSLCKNASVMYTIYLNLNQSGFLKEQISIILNLVHFLYIKVINAHLTLITTPWMV